MCRPRACRAGRRWRGPFRRPGNAERRSPLPGGPDLVERYAEDSLGRLWAIGHYGGLSVHDVGDWEQSFEAGMVLAIRVFGAKVPDRLGWQRTSTIALAAVALGGAVLALWPSVIAVWITTAALAVGMSLLYPALFSAALESVPDHERSQAVGTFSLFFDLSQGAGAPLLGVVVALTSERGAFAVSALLAAAGFWALGRLSRSHATSVTDPTPANL